MPPAGRCRTLVGEARSAERGRDERQQDDGAVLREPVGNEAVRGVVAAALVDGPAVEHPRDRDECRVEDRDGEHEHGQDQRRDGRAGDAPARHEAERRERESEHLRAGVAHEDERRAAGRRLKGRNPRTASASETDRRARGRRRAESRRRAKKPNAIAARVAASPSMLSSRLKAFVIPTSQITASAIAIDWLWTSWTVVPVASTIAAPPSCAASFAMGGSARTSSMRPATKRRRAPAQMPRRRRSAPSGPAAARARR